MRDEKRYFLKILQIEMEDLKEDLDYLIKKSFEDRMHAKITERVHLENVTLFQNEQLGIKEFKELIDETNPEGFETLGAMIGHLRDKFGECAELNDFARAVSICIERKIEKVTRYVTQ